MNSEATDGFTERLKLIVGDQSVRAFASKIGMSHTAAHTYLSGKSDPTRKVLETIASTYGVRMAWLVSGEGPMRPGEAAPAPEAAAAENITIDPVLFGRCLDAINNLFQELNIKAPSTTLGEEAALIYQDVAASGLASLEEQLVAIRALIAQRRRALLAAPPSKHQGSA